MMMYGETFYGRQSYFHCKNIKMSSLADMIGALRVIDMHWGSKCIHTVWPDGLGVCLSTRYENELLFSYIRILAHRLEYDVS